MFRCSFLVLGTIAAGASADFGLTYESDVDLDPNNGDIIDLAPNESATISIWAWPGSTTELQGLGFNLNGVDKGGVLNFEYISLSDFAWAPAPLGDPNSWFAWNELPYPRAINFSSHTISIPVEGLLLATLQVNSGSDFGQSDVSTGPEFWDGNLSPVVVVDTFSMNIIPEPATLSLLALGGVMVLRRRR